MAENLTPAQKRTLPGRQALAAKFASPAEKSAHFRELARRSHEHRLTLNGEEAMLLAQAADFLRRIVERDQRANNANEAREQVTNVA